jgi:hypothetical protein
VGFLLLGIASRNRPSRFSFSITGGGPLFFGVSLSHAWRTRNRSVGTELRARPAPRSNSQDLAAAIRVRKGNPLPRHVPRPRQEYVGVVHGAATRAARIPSPDEGKGWKRVCRPVRRMGLPPRGGLHSICSSLPIGWCRTAQLVGRGRAWCVCRRAGRPRARPVPAGVRQGSSGTTTVCRRIAVPVMDVWTVRKPARICMRGRRQGGMRRA